MANSADQDLDLHCLQKQCISGFSRTRVNQTSDDDDDDDDDDD